MIIDYWEREEIGDRPLIYVGLQFEDEPDSLYAAELELSEEGRVVVWRLMFNGFDCRYAFRAEEKETIAAYLKEQGVEVDYEVGEA